MFQKSPFQFTLVFEPNQNFDQFTRKGTLGTKVQFGLGLWEVVEISSPTHQDKYTLTQHRSRAPTLSRDQVMWGGSQGSGSLRVRVWRGGGSCTTTITMMTHARLHKTVPAYSRTRPNKAPLRQLRTEGAVALVVAVRVAARGAVLTARRLLQALVNLLLAPQTCTNTKSPGYNTPKICGPKLQRNTTHE